MLEKHFDKYIELLLAEQASLSKDDKLLVGRLRGLKSLSQGFFPENSYVKLEDIFKFLNDPDPSPIKDGVKLGDKNITLITFKDTNNNSDNLI